MATFVSLLPSRALFRPVPDSTGGFPGERIVAAETIALGSPSPRPPETKKIVIPGDVWPVLARLPTFMCRCMCRFVVEPFITWVPFPRPAIALAMAGFAGDDKYV